MSEFVEPAWKPEPSRSSRRWRLCCPTCDGSHFVVFICDDGEPAEAVCADCAASDNPCAGPIPAVPQAVTS